MKEKRNTKTLEMVYIALFTVMIAICSWISIPFAVPFTLQTFAIFVTVGLLGGKRGGLAIVVWILLGAVGVPVFSGFNGGIGYLLGSTGGYIFGFLLIALIYLAGTSLLGTKTPVMVISLLIGLLACYAFGTFWFISVYTKTTGAVGIAAALGWCVFPFVIPDLVKLALALVVAKRLAPYVGLSQD